MQLRNNLKTFTLKELKKEIIKMKADTFADTQARKKTVSPKNIPNSNNDMQKYAKINKYLSEGPLRTV